MLIAHGNLKNMKMNHFFKVTALFWILLTIFSFGSSPANSNQSVTIVNLNSESNAAKDFSLLKLQTAEQFDSLPPVLSTYKSALQDFDIYLAKAPTQKTGGYAFLSIETSNGLRICLKSPSPLTPVTMALSNPIALIKVVRGSRLMQEVTLCE